jgi:hypothetical protein
MLQTSELVKVVYCDIRRRWGIGGKNEGGKEFKNSRDNTIITNHIGSIYIACRIES